MTADIPPLNDLPVDEQAELVHMMAEIALTTAVDQACEADVHPKGSPLSFPGETAFTITELHEPPTDKITDDLTRLMTMDSCPNRSTCSRTRKRITACTCCRLKPHVDVYIDGVPGKHNTLVDTGSSFNLLCRLLLQKSIPDWDERLVRRKREIVLGDKKTSITIEGYIELSISMEDEKGVFVSIPLIFNVIKGLPDCIVLGWDMFDTVPIEASNARRCLEIGSHRIPYCEFDHTTLLAVDDIIANPRSITKVPAVSPRGYNHCTCWRGL